MKKITLLIVLLSLMLALGMSACSLSLAQDIKPPPGYQAPVYEEPELLSGAFPLQAPDLANGVAIYQEKCLPCHGDTGLGNGPDSTGLPVPVAQIGDPDLAIQASPLEWYSIVLKGNIERFMPPFSASLSEQDVWDVVSYVYSLSTDQNEVEAGAEVFSQTCAACHGAAGEGPVAPGAFDFSDSEAVVLLSMEDIIQKVATGSGNPEHDFSTILAPEQQIAVAAYLRSLALRADSQPVEAVADSGEEPATVDVTPTPEAADTETPAAEADATDSQDDHLGQVTGVVVNGSGGDLPENLEVTLEIYQEFNILYTETIPAQADGSFVFEDVVLDPELIYITMVEQDGTFFPSAFHMGSETLGKTIDLPITIYEITSETDQLAVSRLHIFFQFTDQGALQVIHQVSISNFGEYMVAPELDGAPVLNFSLPEGASGLVFQSGSLGNPYIQTSAGFADPTAVLPGSNTYDTLFAYQLPYDGKLDWELPMDLPTDVAVIFVQGEEVNVESQTLVPSGTEALDTEVFQVFVANTLSAESVIDLKLSSGFSLSRSLNLDGNLLTIILGVVGLGLAGFGAWRFFRPADEEEEDFEEIEYDPADVVLDQIVSLDEAFVAGEMDEAMYQAQRESLKAKLKRLLDQKETD